METYITLECMYRYKVACMNIGLYTYMGVMCVCVCIYGQVCEYMNRLYTQVDYLVIEESSYKLNRQQLPTPCRTYKGNFDTMHIIFPKGNQIQENCKQGCQNWPLMSQFSLELIPISYNLQ